ncbi:MAG: methyltransferase domain-containing protein [Bacteroidia bacterium]
MEQVGLETLSACPVCLGTQFNPFLSCKDFTVSHETFHIVQCASCGFKFTNPRPAESEIGKYYQSEDYISHSNTSRGIINSLYKVARRFTISRKANLIKSVFPDGKFILDYGCGTGEFLNGMKKAEWSVKGVEPSEQARMFTINNYGLEVIEPNLINSLPEKSFDVITLWHVLEHIHQINQTIIVFRKLLKQKGKLIIAVPNCDAADAVYYKKHWAAYDLPRHLYHFNPDSMHRLMSSHQFRVVKELTMPLDAYYVSMLSEKYKGSLGMIKGILNGAKTNFKSWFEKKKSSSLIFVIEVAET